MSKMSQWVPEIYYEETDEVGSTSHIPFIAVPENEIMPNKLFIFESRATGEVEPGPSGEDLPVFELTLHQYADMDFLKSNLSAETFDEVRLALGLTPLREAVERGKKITERIRQTLN